ncbi:MAG: quinolinate synthase NadA [Deltaproteobacteria bacterium]|jgi:quinolinate synthase|nr:quinolinate synthase NadA [Deltaproteobacteria bacterium]
MFSEKKQNQMIKVRRLASGMGVEILAHFYQRPEIKTVADFVGGSRDIFRWILKTKAQTILLCGVNFMTETIERLRPDLNILIPRLDASCPYSETVTANVVSQIRHRDPKAVIIADAKASGAVKDLSDGLVPLDIPSGYWDNKSQNNRLYILPGPNMFAQETMDSRLMSAVCQVHWQVELADLLKAKREHPEAVVVVNVLCRDEVKDRADQVGDSQTIWNYCSENRGLEFIVVSEIGLGESLALSYPHKRFYDPGVEIFCPNMKLTNLRDTITVLESYQLREGLITRFGARQMGGHLSHDIPG